MAVSYHLFCDSKDFHCGSRETIGKIQEISLEIRLVRGSIILLLCCMSVIEFIYFELYN